MSIEIGIDSKPKNRGISARLNRRKTTLEQKNEINNDGFDDNDASDLNIRVKDRSGDDVVTTAKRNRIGGLFKETPIKGLLKESAADTLKRPLTGLFRRPLSRAGRKRDDEDDSLAPPSGNNNQGSTLDERSLSPEVNLSLPRTEFDAIARAPHLSASQLHGMLQVDIFASKHPQLAKIDDLDISLLSRFLYPEDEVRDEDVPWTWDYLFASVTTEMREEWAHEDVEDH